MGHRRDPDRNGSREEGGSLFTFVYKLRAVHLLHMADSFLARQEVADGLWTYDVCSSAM